MSVSRGLLPRGDTLLRESHRVQGDPENKAEIRYMGWRSRKSTFTMKDNRATIHIFERKARASKWVHREEAAHTSMVQSLNVGSGSARWPGHMPRQIASRQRAHGARSRTACTQWFSHDKVEKGSLEDEEESSG